MILAIDQGTTGTRSMLVDADSRPLAIAYRRHEQITPQPGWVEHNPEEIWRNVELTMRIVLRKAGAKASELAALGVANQGETVMAWDGATGQPVSNAIVWQCDRTRDVIQRLKRDSKLVREIHRTTGLIPDCYFSASKMRWLYDNVGECRSLARGGRLRITTLDAWLIHKLSGGESLLSDATTASRTLLMDLKARRWSERMLKEFRVDEEWLPHIVPSRGQLAMAHIGGIDVPLLASTVDQQAALYGQCCFRTGTAKCTFGTGAFLLMNTGNEPVLSRKGLLTTLANSTGRRTTYALDGGVYVAGAAVSWLRENLGIIESDQEAAALAESVPDSGGISFIPSFAGLAAPYWERNARGTVFGLTSATTRAHLVRAMLEGIALRVYTVAAVMAKESGHKLQSPLRVDGGLTRNRFLMQFLAGLLDTALVVPECDETTALGVAFMAGLEAGIFRNEKELEKQWRSARRYDPSMNAEERASHIERHQRSIRQLLEWASGEN